MVGNARTRTTEAGRLGGKLRPLWLLALVLGLSAAFVHVLNSRASTGTPMMADSVSLAGMLAHGGGFVSTSEVSQHVIAATFRLQAWHRYVYEFKVQRPATQPVDLHIDLFGPDYDEPQRERVHTLGYDAFPAVVRGVLPAGPAPPPVTQLRLFHEGAAGLAITDIRIAEISPWRVFLEQALLLATVITSFWLLLVGVQVMVASEAYSRRDWLLVAVAYLLAVVARFMVSLSLPYWSGDEYVYKGLAAGIWANHHVAGIGADQLAHTVNLPNILYPYLIAPAIGLEENFYTGIRLINALLISAAVFPAYFIAIRLCRPSVALAVAVLAVAIPSVNISAYAVTEVIYHPLALLALWFALRAAERPSAVLPHVVLGVAVGVALNVRLTALAILPGYFLALLVIQWRAGRMVELVKRPAWMGSLLSALCAYALLRSVLAGPRTEGLGVYESQSGGWLSSAWAALTHDPHGGLVLLAGHLAILAIPYSLGLAAAGAMLVRGGRGGDGSATQRDATIILAAFLAALGLAIIFTLGVSHVDLGGLGRWHSRYYFPYLPALLACALSASLPYYDRFSGITLGVIFGLVTLGAVWFLLFFGGLDHVWFGSMVDSMEVQWMKVWGVKAALAGLLATILVAVLAWRRRSVVPLLAAMVVWVLVANTGSWQVLARSPGADDNHCGAVAYHWLRENPGTVAAVANNRADLVDLVFWLPQLPAKAVALPEGEARIDASAIPPVDYVITEGSVEIAGARTVFSSGACRILTTR